MPPSDGAPQVVKTDLSLEEMQAEIYEINQANGWFDSGRSFGDDVALLHSEVSEMFEAFRDHGLADATAPARPVAATNEGSFVQDQLGLVSLPKPEGVGSEAADIFIRLLDTCQRAGINLRDEYTRKVAFNKTRGYKHGGKSV